MVSRIPRFTLFLSRTETNYKYAEFLSVLISSRLNVEGEIEMACLNSYINETFMPDENSNGAAVCLMFVFAAI